MISSGFLLISTSKTSDELQIGGLMLPADSETEGDRDGVSGNSDPRGEAEALKMLLRISGVIPATNFLPELLQLLFLDEPELDMSLKYIKEKPW